MTAGPVGRDVSAATDVQLRAQILPSKANRISGIVAPRVLRFGVRINW